MNKLETIKKKIEQIEELLAEIKGEVDALSQENESRQTKPRQTAEVLPSDEELRSEYDRLYQDFVSSNSGAVEGFIKSKSKTYLKAFCRANNLPVDITKVSKARIVDVVLQWMAQRKAITQKTA
jgi:curved DNA-binding protein CbpA